MIRPVRCFIIGRSTACVQTNAPAEVHLEHAVPVLALHAHQQLVAGDAGVVHQDVDAAVLREDLPERRLGGRRVGHVHDDRRRSRVRARAAWPRSAAGSGLTTSVGTTTAPHDARATLMDRPMPRPAPVTTATFPVKSNMAH